LLLYYGIYLYIAPLRLCEQLFSHKGAETQRSIANNLYPVFFSFGINFSIVIYTFEKAKK